MTIRPFSIRILCALLVTSLSLVSVSHAADEYYTQAKVYNLRPNPTRERPFGHLGPTGIHAHIHKGVAVTVETVADGSPAAGKIAVGDIILGVNGAALKGLNPFVEVGKAITEAEAGDGQLVFDIQRDGGQRKITVSIPALGAYSDTWPVDCPKSKKIIEQAAAYYHKRLARDQKEIDGIPGAKDENQGIPGALMCLFLLSTGDDAHLPVVKDYFKPFIANPQSIGDHTWNNGYNGVACAEYYLRTGDKDVLPVLQYYCDNAKERQKFGSAWPHWGKDINPRYVAGGLMNPASAQVLTTLLLGKECGVDVDDTTLLGSLTFFYRFVGHGTVPYGDHRSEGGLGSNGKDGMISAAMQIAAGAAGDTSIYQSARDYLAMSTLKSYPSLATGHGDNGRGDGMWRGASAAYLREKKPEDYRAMMDRLKWWFDLSRFHDGAIGIATIGGFNDPGSGAGMALAYTAHLKNLRIHGASKSKFAVGFTLPEHLWGREADLAFHSIEHNPKFFEHGKEMAPHEIMSLLGNAYNQTDPEQLGATREQILQNVYHHRYMFRSQACKALVKSGELEMIEKLLTDPDPRLRRAALDGIIDWRYWFAMGKNPLPTEQYTPGMITAITAMITNPDESLLVVEGALFAMRNMPTDVIEKHVDAIMPWTTHDEWWLRQSAFMALQGLDKDPVKYITVLPKLMDIFVAEYHTQGRGGMGGQLGQALKKAGADSEIGQIILAGLATAASESAIKPGLRTREGAWNVLTSIRLAMDNSTESAADLAARLGRRVNQLDTGSLIEILAVGGAGGTGFYPMLERAEGDTRQRLVDVLYETYLPELTERLKQDKGANLSLIDSVLMLKRLKEDVAGWQALGAPAPGERAWRFVSLDPASESDMKPPRERKRFRDIALPQQYKNWFKPGFDDSGWNEGRAPIGVGEFRGREIPYPTQSAWGDGEFLLARTTFDVENPDYDIYRLRVLNNQGFHIYLNGTKVQTYVWWKDGGSYWKIGLSEQEGNLLKKGTNTLAVYANVEYPSAMKPNWKQERFGKIDVYIEGLRKSDLY
ncbi:MAG: DUF6288 domain-containing protein [Lentisphaeria bacterium]|nr:DUF6288 domain-containing protein [Lentisphaeria bacterium]